MPILYTNISRTWSERPAPWKTLDICLGCDFPWDLSRGIPSSLIQLTYYSSHLLNIYPFLSKKLISECFRVLKTGGILYMCSKCKALFAYVDGKSHKTKGSSWYPGWPDNSCLIRSICIYGRTSICLMKRISCIY